MLHATCNVLHAAQHRVLKLFIFETRLLGKQRKVTANGSGFGLLLDQGFGFWLVVRSGLSRPRLSPQTGFLSPLAWVFPSGLAGVVRQLPRPCGVAEASCLSVLAVGTRPRCGHPFFEYSCPVLWALDIYGFGFFSVWGSRA